MGGNVLPAAYAVPATVALCNAILKDCSRLKVIDEVVEGRICAVFVSPNHFLSNEGYELSRTLQFRVGTLRTEF